MTRYVVDSLELENIRAALIENTPMKERRSVARSLNPKKLSDICKDCTVGKMPNELPCWGAFFNNSLVHVIFDEDSVERFKHSKAFKDMEVKKIRIGWR